MREALLTTKLYMPPPRPNLVPRPRLTGQLARAFKTPLTLISAPAGFGKTTAVGECRNAPGGAAEPLAWLSLDQGDNNPRRFWAHVIAALQTLPAFADAPGLGATTLDALAAAPVVAPERFLTPLINDVAACADPFVLALDDYHVIETPAIHAAAVFLIEHLPPSMHLAILTRADPPWPLARLRANGRLAEVRAADLRFTPAEVAALLNGQLGLDLSVAALSALESRTEGWIAALQMAGLALAGHPDRHALIRTFTGDHRYIADYLIEEVLARQPEPVQQFLLRTAVLERFCAPLCAAVTDQEDAGASLDRLERAGLFLIPLDSARQWYRYHHLFADLLRARVQHAQPDLVPVLHRRAAAWFEANAYGADAVHHALAAADYQGAAHLIEQYAPRWWSAADSPYWTLIARLPPAVVQSRPTFCIYQAWVHIMAGRLADAAPLIAAAEAHLAGPAADREPDAPALRRFIPLLRAYIAELTGQPYAPADLDLAGPSAIPEANAGIRNSADVLLAYVLYMNGDLERAAPILAGAAERDIAFHSSNAVPIAISRVMRIRVIQGRLREAEQLGRRSLATIAARGAWRFFINGNLHSALADVLRERNDLEQAETEAREGIDQNRPWPFLAAIPFSQCVLARVLLARGRADDALVALAAGEQHERSGVLPGDLISERNAVRVRLWLARGNLAAARQWAANSGLGTHDPLSFRRELDHMTLARVLIAAGRAEPALSLLGRLAAAAAAGGRAGRLIEILVLQAVAHQALGQPGRGVQALTRALALAEPEGFVRVFADEGAPVAELLSSLREAGGPADYVGTLLDACGGAVPPGQAGPLPPGAPPLLPGAPPPALVEPLSGREREVLQLLAAGLSNRAIAAQLTVSVGTVKTHVHNLYGKLGAQSRTQAVARARALRLI